MTKLSQSAQREKALREKARRYPLDFNKYIYPDYEVSWHIELLCDALYRVYIGEIRFLIVEMPPRHSKSLNVSQLFPAWVVGKDPDKSVIVSSYSGDLAVDHGRETRNIIKTAKYQNIFNTQLSPDSDAKGKWNTQKLNDKGEWINAKGAYNAVGVGGSATGKGADIFVVDDPFKDRKEADSQLIRDDRWKWLRSVARTRLTPTGGMVVTHTRWHNDDIIGRFTEVDEYKEDWVDYFEYLEGKRAKWVRLNLKAIADSDEPYRKEGEALWPTRYNLEELSDIRATLGTFEWAALYQQAPILSENAEFQPLWFQTRKREEIDRLETNRFLTVDTAISAKASADYTGFADNTVDQENKWNVEAWRMKFNPKDLIDYLFTLHHKNQYTQIGIEKTIYLDTLKPFLDDEMRKRNVFLPIVELKHNQTSKELRIRSLIPRYQSKSIYHIAASELEDELLAFPKGVHDDVADAMAYQTQIAEPPHAGSRAMKSKMRQTRHKNSVNIAE